MKKSSLNFYEMGSFVKNVIWTGKVLLVAWIKQLENENHCLNRPLSKHILIWLCNVILLTVYCSEW
jgi:hypothetical protein